MIFLILSLLLVAFGQPAWSSFLGILASYFGYALFFYVILDLKPLKKRFWIATGWYALVQLIDLSWAFSHPFAYVYIVLPLVAFFFGCQWGLFSLLIRRDRIDNYLYLFGLAGVWTLLEWVRLFIFSGLPFNPAGLALTGYIWPLQFASLFGIYGLSFLVILTNLFCLLAFFKKSSLNFFLFFLLAFMPHVFGFFHLSFHSKESQKFNKFLNVLLIQPAHPVIEDQSFQSAEEYRKFILKKWRAILGLFKEHIRKKIDLIVLPEYIVPYGTFHFIYPIEEVESFFKELFEDDKMGLPSFDSPYADLISITSRQDKRWLVSNAYIAQRLANYFNSDLIIGLEDSVYVDPVKHIAETYSAAFYFQSHTDLEPERYEKRILVPMGEYIPFKCFQDLAGLYGIRGSFTPGKEAKTFSGSLQYIPSICYEELFGNLTREGRLKGGEIFVNLTNDGWFPNSFLARQHFDHARLRSVENGIPLLRSTNTGLTAGVDSLGRIIAVLPEEKPSSLYLTMPLYSYKTWYTWWGDRFILLFSFLCSFFLFKSSKKNLAQNEES